jgi:hypothetical protein
MVALAAGIEIATAGAAFATVRAEVGPAARARPLEASDAVPAARDTVMVPFPVQEVSCTVRAESPVPRTLTVQLAVPVLASVTSAAARVTAAAFV